MYMNECIYYVPNTKYIRVDQCVNQSSVKFDKFLTTKQVTVQKILKLGLIDHNLCLRYCFKFSSFNTKFVRFRNQKP